MTDSRLEKLRSVLKAAGYVTEDTESDPPFVCGGHLSTYYSLPTHAAVIQGVLDSNEFEDLCVEAAYSTLFMLHTFCIIERKYCE